MACGLYYTVGVAQAANTQPSGGITVSPASATVQVGSLQRQASFAVGVKNNFSFPITLTARLSGLTVDNNRLMPSVNADATVSQSTTITPSTFTLQPGNAANVLVTITDSPQLSPGGHYLSLLITQTASAGELSQLSLQAAVSTTVYVVKEDGAKRAITATTISLNRSIFSLPSLADVSFYNNGNTSTVPRGVLFVTKNGNPTIYAKGIINAESIPLFPRQTTKLQSQIMSYSNSVWPGKYSVTTSYHYDGGDSVKTVSVSFWYIPKTWLILAIFVLAICAYLVSYKRRQKVTKIAKRLVAGFKRVQRDGALNRQRQTYRYTPPRLPKKITLSSEDSTIEKPLQVVIKKASTKSKKGSSK